MPFQKQAIAVNFAQGLDTKTDPWQVELGKFLTLNNMVFTTGDMLKKRNGYEQLPSLPNATFSYVTTLNDNLTTLGTSVAAYAAGSMQWVDKGSIQPMQVSTLPLIRNNLNQTQCDAVLAPNNTICTVYTENNGSSNAYKYAVADNITGQNIVAPIAIPVASGAITGSPRVFLLGNFFVIVFTNTIAGTHHLQYISIPVSNPSATPTTNEDIAVNYTPTNGLSWDGIVAPGTNNLYIAYPTASGGQSVKVTYLPLSAAAIGGPPATPTSFATYAATLMSVSVDIATPTNPQIFINFYDSGSGNTYSASVLSDLTIKFTPQLLSSVDVLANITSSCYNGTCYVVWENINNYSYDTIRTDFLKVTVVLYSGTVGATSAVIRSVGLASKAFTLNGTIYVLSLYESPYQPTYFLINVTESICISCYIS